METCFYYPGINYPINSAFGAESKKHYIPSKRMERLGRSIFSPLSHSLRSVKKIFIEDIYLFMGYEKTLKQWIKEYNLSVHVYQFHKSDNGVKLLALELLEEVKRG